MSIVLWHIRNTQPISILWYRRWVCSLNWCKERAFKWKYKSDGPINSTPLVDHHGNVFIQAVNDQSYSLKGKTGEVLWKQETGLSLGRPIQFDYRGNFLINRNLNELALLCGESGDELWDFKLSENGKFYPSSPPLLPDLHGNDMIVSGAGKQYGLF